MNKKLNYNDYWEHCGARLRKKLREREVIFIDWIKEGSSVLSVGCGNSPLLLRLKENKKCVAEGIDISSVAVDIQRKAGIESRVADIGGDEFKLDKQYDCIILSEVLEHIANPEDTMLKIAGKAEFFLISIPNSAFYRFRFYLMFKGRFFKQWAEHPSEHLRYWSHLDFIDWLGGLGFEIVDITPSNGLDVGPIKFFKFWKNLFGHQICYLAKTKK